MHKMIRVLILIGVASITDSVLKATYKNFVK